MSKPQPRDKRGRFAGRGDRRGRTNRIDQTALERMLEQWYERFTAAIGTMPPSTIDAAPSTSQLYAALGDAEREELRLAWRRYHVAQELLAARMLAELEELGVDPEAVQQRADVALTAHLNQADGMLDELSLDDDFLAQLDQLDLSESPETSADA